MAASIVPANAPAVSISGKEYSRTHQHYMAAVHLFNGESEAMVAEMYDFAHGLEGELALVRAQLLQLQQQVPAPAPRRTPLFSRLLRWSIS